MRANEDRQLVELVDGLSAPQLAVPVRYRRIIGEGLEEVRAGDVLLTLFNHQTHHRGQVHVLLTQADVTPPPLDVVFFSRGDRRSGTARHARARRFLGPTLH